MASPHAEHTATLLDDGRVLVAGGLGSSDASAETAVSELYDPATGGWSRTDDLHVARWDARASLLDDGRVLVTGGVVHGNGTTVAEIWDPATGEWTDTAP